MRIFYMFLFKLFVSLFYHLSLSNNIDFNKASAWSFSSKTKLISPLKPRVSLSNKNIVIDDSIINTKAITHDKNNNDSENRPRDYSRRSSRREILLASFLISSSSIALAPAYAFDNAMPEAQKYADKPKRRGTAPKDLGLLPRTIEGEFERVTKPGLRTCNGDPNCFSTTGDFVLEDRTQVGIDWLIAPWKPPTSDTKPLKTIADVMKLYEPGQNNIDGAGFSIIKETETYLYYQFESLKKGYIDDLEFAFPTQKEGSTAGILVRSASRVGFTDFGVNAIRLNYIASKLRKEYGWTITEISDTTHRDYWITAYDAREATFDPDRRK